MDIQVPDPGVYEAKVSLCQEYIAAGESYELCLTDQTLVTRRFNLDARVGGSCGSVDEAEPEPGLEPGQVDNNDMSWAMFKTLRARQPVPFGSYLRLGGATLVSSSPERFLEHDAHGLCSMRPMKGTVRKRRKSATGGRGEGAGESAGAATLEEAERILHVPKEEAENLMIVDLVRHDLHGVCGAGNVRVPHLLKVEEYASVFQMITVVEGRLHSATRGTGDHAGGGSPPSSPAYTGLDALAASLPPGSMTGAPKKRSCEILRGIEGGRERSLYSGVVGYIDVTGRGDWSVTIRSLFRWDDETKVEVVAEGGAETSTSATETWHVGAGGAVTILSTAAGERDEMMAKLAGPLGIFGVSL